MERLYEGGRMKLRNKKTGEIKEWDSIGFRKGRSNGWDDFTPNADSLAALNEVWEDYKPTEPLIKDEKIRKAVRAWAEVNSVKEVLYAERQNRSLCVLEDMGEDGYSIDLVGWIPTLEDGEVYTITELCGEEEE
jgi:hypothetical protein